MKYEKIFDKEKILYLIFGILTTVLSYLIYIMATRLLGTGIVIGNILSWIISVMFAYVTNKLYVFNSITTTKKEVFKEIGLFISSRIVSGITETLLLVLIVNIVGINDIIAKVIVGLIVIVMNYFLSKFMIFR